MVLARYFVGKAVYTARVEEMHAGEEKDLFRLDYNASYHRS